MNHHIKTSYTIIYNEPVEDEKFLKRDTLFLERISKNLDTMKLAVNSFWTP